VFGFLPSAMDCIDRFGAEGSSKKIPILVKRERESGDSYAG